MIVYVYNNTVPNEVHSFNNNRDFCVSNNNSLVIEKTVSINLNLHTWLYLNLKLLTIKAPNNLTINRRLIIKKVSLNDLIKRRRKNTKLTNYINNMKGK